MKHAGNYGLYRSRRSNTLRYRRRGETVRIALRRNPISDAEGARLRFRGQSLRQKDGSIFHAGSAAFYAFYSEPTFCVWLFFVSIFIL